MAEIIEMPKLSDTMTVGTLVKWLKKEGDKVAPGDMLCEVETDKATMEVENFAAGVMLKHYVAAGGQVPVGAPMCAIGKAGEAVPAAPTIAPKAAPAPAKPAAAAAPAKSVPTPVAKPATTPAPQPSFATGEETRRRKRCGACRHRRQRPRRTDCASRCFDGRKQARNANSSFISFHCRLADRPNWPGRNCSRLEHARDDCPPFT